MEAHPEYDAVIVGAGPNGLAAGITLARFGLSVAVLEAHSTIGGGTRSAELTLPGYRHDICSAIHPLGVESPFFRSLPLEKFGLEWVYSPVALAHPFDDGTVAAAIVRSVEETAETMGQDARAYRALFGPLVAHWEQLAPELLAPLHLPRHPYLMARFWYHAMQSSYGLAKRHFEGPAARGIFCGMAAHSMLPLDSPLTASFGLVLGTLAHVVGWPLARGGSQSIAEAMGHYFESLGGKIITDAYIKSLADLPPSRAILFDLTPRQILRIAGERLPVGYRLLLENYRYGIGVFKIDWALEAPIPFRTPLCTRAATIHVGGPIEEMAFGEQAVWEGKHPDRPFVILAQPTLFDSSRAPAGQHTAWAYSHVPRASTVDMTSRIENQIERYAPGFRERIIARHIIRASEYEAYNANYIGGDINGGVQDWRQMFARPASSRSPYTMPTKGFYICSSSTPPGGGVHGMCGFYAARAALKDIFNINVDL